jgi:LacI family transcriptional regulator
MKKDKHTNSDGARSGGVRPRSARPRIKDIARYAGVSYSTAARVLSRSGNYAVSDKMRQHVLDVARKHRYSTDPFARYMRKQRSHIIGICGVMPRTSSDAASSYRIELNRRVAGIHASPHSTDYNLMLLLREDQTVDLEARLTQGIAYMDGLIYVSPTTKQKPLLKRLAKRVPLVLEDAQGLDDLCSVSVEQYAAIESAARLLVNRGCKRLALLTHHGAEYYHNQVRLRAFRETVQALRLPLEADQVVVNYEGRQGARSAISWLLRARQPIDGLIAPRDEELVGVLDAIEEAGLTMGKEIKLISMNETELSRHMKPGISVVRFPAEQVAREAFELLVRLIEGQVHETEHILAPASIVERQSTTG